SFAVFEDKNGTISNDSIFNDSFRRKFKPLKTNKFYAGTTKSSFWLKTTLFDIGNAAGVLEVDAPYLSSVTLFRVSEDGSIQEWQNGMEIMPSDSEVQSGSIGFKITPQDENEHLYLRIRAESIISFSIRFYSPNQWSNYQSWRRTILIIFVTLFLLLSFGCIILWLMRREAIFLYYFGAVISFSVITLYTYGFANELWQFHYLPSFILSFIAICLLCLFGIFRSLLSLLSSPLSD
ncbi:MAG: 7TM-DISM domain-containing protein, partial [Crocinitomicaceae bacterium]